MPGIAGIIDLEGKYDLEERITKMLNLMRHKSWQGAEYFRGTPEARGRASSGT